MENSSNSNAKKVAYGNLWGLKDILGDPSISGCVLNGDRETFWDDYKLALLRNNSKMTNTVSTTKKSYPPIIFLLKQSMRYSNSMKNGLWLLEKCYGSMECGVTMYREISFWTDTVSCIFYYETQVLSPIFENGWNKRCEWLTNIWSTLQLLLGHTDSPFWNEAGAWLSDTITRLLLNKEE